MHFLSGRSGPRRPRVASLRRSRRAAPRPCLRLTSCRRTPSNPRRRRPYRGRSRGGEGVSSWRDWHCWLQRALRWPSRRRRWSSAVPEEASEAPPCSLRPRARRTRSHRCREGRRRRPPWARLRRTAPPGPRRRQARRPGRTSTGRSSGPPSPAPTTTTSGSLVRAGRSSRHGLADLASSCPSAASRGAAYSGSPPAGIDGSFVRGSAHAVDATTAAPSS
jgi:hypothetical protein